MDSKRASCQYDYCTNSQWSVCYGPFKGTVPQVRQRAPERPRNLNAFEPEGVCFRFIRYCFACCYINWCIFVFLICLCLIYS